MKNLVILGTIAVLLGGFVYYTLFTTPAYEIAQEANDSLSQLESEVEKVPPEPVVPEQGVGTLESLRLLGASAECTISYTPTGSSSAPVEGTYFVNKGMMRGDFLTDSPELGGQILSSMIMTDDQLYVWSEIAGKSYGFKTPKGTLSESENNVNTPIGMDTDVDYQCKSWKEVDGSIFIPPSDVLFNDMSALQRTGMEYGTIYEEGSGVQ